MFQILVALLALVLGFFLANKFFYIKIGKEAKGISKPLPGPPVFQNAQKIAKLFPDKFHVPNPIDLAMVAPSTLVKIATGVERFWVEVKEREGDKLGGIIDNELESTHWHGLSEGNYVGFSIEHIYEVHEDAIKPLHPIDSVQNRPRIKRSTHKRMMEKRIEKNRKRNRIARKNRQENRK